MFKPIVLSVVALIFVNGILGFEVPQEEREFEGYDVDTKGALFLTPLIKNGKIQEARDKSRVTPLLGNDVSHAGFLTVNETSESNIFVWVFLARNNSREAKTVLWLQGGPGYSSLYGLFGENGPYEVPASCGAPGANCTSINHLVARKESWNSEFNVIYMDLPAGTGYSFTKWRHGYLRNVETVAYHAGVAMGQIEKLFPELKGSLIIGGESYGSKYATLVASYLTNSYYRSKLEVTSNIHGVYLGNPGLDLGNHPVHSSHLYSAGVIDQAGQKKIKSIENTIKLLVQSGQHSEAAAQYGNLMIESINYPNPTVYQKLTGLKSHYSTANDYTPCNTVPVIADSEEMRRRVHVGAIRFKKDRAVYRFLQNDVFKPVTTEFENLLHNDVRALIVVGQHDPLTPYPYVEQLIDNLDWSGSSDYDDSPRAILRWDDDVVGYYKKAHGFARVLLRNSGQLAPKDQPTYTLGILKKFSEGFFDDEGDDRVDG
jgi:carboxypeptidase C (cathepsin A)